VHNEEAVVEVISSLLSVAMIMSVSIAALSWGNPYIEDFQSNTSIQSVQNQFTVLSQSIANMANEDMHSSSRSYDLTFSKGEVNIDSYADRMILSYVVNEENHMNYNFTVHDLDSSSTDFSITLHKAPENKGIEKIEAFYFESAESQQNDEDTTIINIDEAFQHRIISSKYVTFTWPEIPGVRNRYQLENYMNLWSSWSKETSKTYTSLADGEYIFKLQPEAGQSYEYSFQKMQGLTKNETLLPISPGGTTYSFTSENIVEGTARLDVYNSDEIFGRIFIFDLGYLSHTFSSSLGEYKTILQNNGLLSVLSGDTILKQSPALSVGSLDRAMSSQSTVPSGNDWWPMVHQNPQNTGFSTSPQAPQTNNTLWNYSTEAYILRSSPSIVNDKLYIGTYDDLTTSGGTLHCIDALNGNHIWSFEIEGPDLFFASSPAVVNTKVYICSALGILYCLDADNGEKLWEKNIDSVVQFSSPIIDDNKIYIGTNKGINSQMLCLDALAGTELWSFGTGGMIQSSAAFFDDKIYFGSADSNIYCLNATTGEKIWDFSRGGNEVASVIVDNGKVYVGAYRDGVYCLNADTGEILWHYEIVNNASFSSIAIYDDKVYTSTGTVVLCLDALNGSQIWRLEDNVDFHVGSTGFFQFANPVIAAGQVYFWTIGSRGHIFCFDAEDGQIIWTHPIARGAGPHTGPVIANGRLYVGSRDGNVYCFGDEIQEDDEDPQDGEDSLQKMISFRVTQFRTPARVFTLAGKQINVNIGFSLQIDNSREVLTNVSSIKIQLYGPHYAVWMNFFANYGFDQIGENMLVFDKGKTSLLSLTQTMYHISVR